MREHWGSRWGFILAVAGSAIGLGNIWKFPFICGMNGGGAFVILYILCVLFVGFPLLLAELTLGRAAQRSAVGAFAKMTKAKTIFADGLGVLLVALGVILLVFKYWGHGTFCLTAGISLLLFGWKTVGFISGMIIPVIITGYYAVIGGWTLIYMGKSFLGQLNFNDQTGAEAVMGPIASASNGMMGWVIASSILFLLLCGGVVFSGVQKGIERWSKVLMPMLFVLLIVLICRGLSLPGAMKGVKWFLSPDFSKLNADSVIAAMGHSFFSLSLAMGIVLTYGSYLSKKENIVQSAVSILVLDTTAALMAGLAIFPAVFAMGFKETSGPVLIYEILPAAFNQLPAGWLWNGLFFMMISVAALTSGMSLLEPPVRIFTDEFKMKRSPAICLTLFMILVIAVVCSISMANWNNFPRLHAFLLKVWNNDLSGSMFGMLDSFACNWLLPLCGFMLAIYVGWTWGARKALKELREGTSPAIDGNLWLRLAGIKDEGGSGGRKVSLFSFSVVWGFFIRLVTPILVFIAFLDVVGVIKFTA